MDTNEILKKVRKIEIKTKGLSKHIFSGEYHSAFKGRGMSFSEVRDYQYGDDVRNIDWNVTARTGDAHVKVFEEERELTIMFLIDMSQSSFFGTRKAFKNEIITEIAAVIGFSALSNNDKVGAILFTDQIEKYIPPKKGRKHILLLIRELINFEAKNNLTDVGVALQYLNNVIKKRSISFVLSDFMAEGYESALNIAAKKHDLVGLRIYDKMDESLPDAGLIRVRDSETGQVRIIDSSSKAIRTAYSDNHQKRVSYFEDNFKKSGSDTVSIQTDEDYIKTLLKFFKRRSR